MKTFTVARTFVLLIAIIHMFFMVVRWTELDLIGIVYAGLMAIVTLLAVISMQLDQLLQRGR